MTNLENRALGFAIAAHASINQLRKYTREAYVVHPIEVAGYVRAIGGDEAMVAAAYLHDTVEDVPWVTPLLILDTFGPDVSFLVGECTDVPIGYGNRASRSLANRLKLADISARGATIKLADLRSNTQSIVARDPGFAEIYMEEKLLALPYLSHGNQELFQVVHQQLEDYYNR